MKKIFIYIFILAQAFFVVLCYFISRPPLNGRYQAGYFSSLSDSRQHLLFKDGEILYVTYDENGEITKDVYGVYVRRDNIIFVNWDAADGPNGIPFVGSESYVLSIGGLSLVDPRDDLFLERIYW